MLVIDPHYNFNLTMSYSLDAVWWPEQTPKLISASREDFPKIVEEIKNYNEKKIVLINLADFFRENYDLHWADLVIFFTTEALEETTQAEIDLKLQLRFNTKKFIVIAGGADSRLQLDDRYYLCNPETFTKVVCANEPYLPVTNKQKQFDALLGNPKTFRQYIFQKILRYNLLEKGLVSIHPQNPDWNEMNPSFPVFNSPYGIGIPSYESPELTELEHQDVKNFKIQEQGKKFFSSANINKTFLKNKDQLNQWYGLNLKDVPSDLAPIHLFNPLHSQLIPKEIYDNTWYSIVSETYCRSVNLLTEKTAKCLLSRRMFIMFGSKGQLDLLRSYGFQTFDPLINSYYDIIDNLEDRFEEAWKSVIKLSESDMRDIYLKLEQVLEHNYKTITDLHTPYRNLQKFISRHVNTI